MRSVEPQPNNSTGGSSFAACPEELCTQCHVQGHQGCEGHRLCQDLLGSHLATSAGYGCGRRGKVLASEALEASQHHLGPLLESFLTLRTSNLTFQEVVDCVLKENHRASEQSLHHLKGRHVHDREVLEGLIKAHGELDKMDKAAQKSLKKEIDQRRKSLEALKEHISYCETQLGQEPSEGNAPDDDSQAGHGAQAEMAPTLGADDAPSESTMTPATPASNPPPAEDQTQDMEVEDFGTRPRLPSPVSCEDDDLLTGLPQSEVTEVESGWAHLTILSPRGPNGEGEEASI